MNGALGLSLSDGIARIAINRPDQHNTLTRQMWRDLQAMLAELAASPGVRVVLFSGTGKAFCAGTDLRTLANRPVAEVEEAFAEMEGALAAVADTPIPTIAAVHGYALGAGLLLALACDIRVAALGTRLGMPIAQLGITATPTMARFLVDAVGPDAARELLLTGRVVKATEGRRLGLVHHVLALEELNEYASSVAARVAAQSPAAVRAAKQAVSTAALAPARSHSYGPHIDPHDFSEGVAAFLEKRSPRFGVRR